MANEERASILSSVSNWLKLVALISLIAESVAVTGMLKAPPADQIWYLIVIVFFLLVIIIGLFFDRHDHRKENTEKLKLELGNQKLTVPAKVSTEVQHMSQNLLRNPDLGFTMELPFDSELGSPKYMSYIDYASVTFHIDRQLLTSQLNNTSIPPLTYMMNNGSVVMFQKGKPLECLLTDDTTTDEIEFLIDAYVQGEKKGGRTLTEKDTAEMRIQMSHGTLGLTSIDFTNSFIIHVMKKSDAGEFYAKKLTLPRLFIEMQSLIKEPIEGLSSSKEVMLWGTTSALKSVSINGYASDLTVYRMYGLYDGGSNVYFLQIQWSPQTEAAITVWEQLRTMFQTFRPN